MYKQMNTTPNNHVQSERESMWGPTRTTQHNTRRSCTSQRMQEAENQPPPFFWGWNRKHQRGFGGEWRQILILNCGR